LFFLSFILGAFAVAILLKKINKNFSFLTLTRYYINSWVISNVLPARVGDFSLVIFLKKEKVKAGEGSALLFLNKLITLLVLLIFAAFGFFIFSNTNVLWILLGVLILIILLGYGILSGKIGILANKFWKKIANFYKEFEETWRLYVLKGKKYLFGNFLITILTWGLASLQIYILFLAFNYHVGFFTVLVISSITDVLSFIPISISGLGIRETSAVFLFSRVNVDSAVTASVYLTLLVIKYVIIIFLVPQLLRTKISFKEN